MEYTFNIDKWPDIAQKYPKTMRLVTVEVLRIVVARLESTVVSKTPAGVGGEAGLRGSINGQVMPYGDPVTGAVGSPLEYAAPVEYGTKPHMPPVAPIELWCRRILGLDGKEARSAAFAIAMKIKKKGTEGKHMFEDSIKELQPWMQQQMNNIPVKVMKRVGKS